MKSQFKTLFVVFTLLFTPLLVSAQANEAIIKVSGEVTTPLNITGADFKTYSQVKLKQ